MIPASCTPQPFDAEILGQPVWRLGDASQATAAVSAAREAGVGLISYRGNDEAVAAAGFRHVETLVTFERPLPDIAAMPDGIATAVSQDADAVAKIARTAFTFDRWHADPAIPNDLAGAYKETWARNDVLGRAETVLLAAETEGAIQGFNALLVRDDTLIIDLIAVAPLYRGKGVGRRMIEAAKAFGAGRFAVLRVGTQTANTASIQLYETTGLWEVGREATWHWTPERI